MRLRPRVTTWGATRPRSTFDAQTNKPAQLAPTTPDAAPARRVISWPKARRGRPASAVYQSHTPEKRQAAVEAVYELGRENRGTVRTVAARFNVHPSTLSTWLGQSSGGTGAVLLTRARRAGAPTVIPEEVEAALARIVWLGHTQNRVLDRYQVMALAADTAARHGITWRVRAEQHLKIADLSGTDFERSARRTRTAAPQTSGMWPFAAAWGSTLTGRSARRTSIAR